MQLKTNWDQHKFEHRTAEQETTRHCELGRWPHRGLGAAVPLVAALEPFLEQDLLACGAGLLVQGAEIPKHRDIVEAPATDRIQVELQELGHNL